MSALPVLHVADDAEHGVSIFAARIAEHARAAAGPGAATDPTRVHLHFTDRLWGADPSAAADAIERVARDRRVTVTLHDLPQPSDGERNLPRRAEAYRRVVVAVDGVVCNSAHEAGLLRRFVVPEARATVIPLPVSPSPSAAEGRADAVTVAILGFVYPGKGHEQAIHAAAALREGFPGIRVAALGRASAGHERDVEGLGDLAASLGVGFEVTGYLSDDELRLRAASTAVPLIAHQHVSASGSLATWLESGRRPVVVRSPYMEEMAALHRGALTLVDADRLVDALRDALEHPESTLLGEGTVLGADPSQTGAAYVRFWAETAR